MNICITSRGKEKESSIDSRFGRCSYFFLYDTDTSAHRIISNEALKNAGGAGIRSAQLMSDEKIDAVLTGQVGPNAYEALEAANISVYTGIKGTIESVISNFLSNQYWKSTKATVLAHSGKGA